MPGLRPAAPGWLLLLAAGAAGGALYLLGPADLVGVVPVALAVASVAAVFVGARRLPAGQRGPWLTVAAALVLFLGGVVLRLVVPGATDTPPGPAAFVPDLLTVPGYLVLAHGLIGMLRRRRAAEDDPARTDAILIGLGAGLVLWSLLIAPRVDTDRGPSAAEIATVFFPLLDVLLLVVVAQLMLAGGVRTPALWLTGLASSAMFVGDLLFAMRDSVAVPMPLFDLLFLTAFVTVGSAALHPSMRTLTEPQRIEVVDLGYTRTAGITLVLVAPGVLATISPPPSLGNALVRLGLSALLTAAVVTRVVRANNCRARAERAARRRATHDALTNLPNRELLAETIAGWHQRAEGDGLEVSLLFLDLDRFKMVNDSWGHQIGDELLCAVADRLAGLVREDDLVCRIGGDEFVIALAGSAPASLAESLARRLLTEFGRPFRLSIGDVTVTPSIGIARSTGVTAALELIRDADTAMYQAKSSGRNGYAFFDVSLRERVRTRVDLEQALRGARERGELSVHYQPIVDLGSGELTGFEALMRWQHPQFGAVSPLQFIPIAEETGMIVDSGAWLLEQACAQLVCWSADRPAGAAALHVSVNISVRQLRDDALVDVVRGVLRRTGLPATSLWLEITESGVMVDPEMALVTLDRLRALGVTLCIDDFGTGYSSLSYLRRLPASIVKIDRSFVAGVGTGSANESIVRAVVAMAHALGQRVVAEGVETVAQRDWLRAQGCDIAQGWLYGAARPATADIAWTPQPSAV